MPDRGDQAGYRAGAREVFGPQCGIREDLAQYHGQERAAGGREGLGRRAREAREAFVAGSRSRRLGRFQEKWISVFRTKKRQSKERWRRAFVFGGTLEVSGSGRRLGL